MQALAKVFAVVCVYNRDSKSQLLFRLEKGREVPRGQPGRESSPLAARAFAGLVRAVAGPTARRVTFGTTTSVVGFAHPENFRIETLLASCLLFHHVSFPWSVATPANV